MAHLYQAVLNHEEHVSKVDYITTLAGYVHWKLTGEKVLGVGDASGMFPIDPATHTYETEFIKRFDAIEEVAAQPWKLENLLPRPLVAGTPAGTLTAERQLLDPTGTLQPGVVLAPPRSDAGTGMVATNSVRVRTGTSPPALRSSPWSCLSTSWRACIRKSTSSTTPRATWPA